MVTCAILACDSCSGGPPRAKIIAQLFILDWLHVHAARIAGNPKVMHANIAHVTIA